MARIQADVVIVGMGAAGACAAIEAARAGADVLIVDRFTGGGASRISGGVIYAGGGTAVQREAGVADSADDMYAYLKKETGDAVSDETLRRFCDSSAEMIDWLREQGVPFAGSLCPYKTSYPTNRHYLYYSGSEASGGFRDVARPAPRGHRAVGRGTSGKVLFDALADAMRARGVRMLTQTRVTGLISGDDGQIAGVRAETLRGARAGVPRAHRWLSKLATKPGLYVPALSRRLSSLVRKLERRHAKPLEIHAPGGVILSAGGFIANREMVREHAPAYRGGLQLGTRADDGSGITMGQQAGGRVAKLGHISAWRFITPPSAFLSGLLVNTSGARVCDESRYGAALGNKLVEEHGGRGWLLIDTALRHEAKKQIPAQTVWFQRLQARYLLSRRAVSGRTVEEAAVRAGVDPAGLRSTVDAHNLAAAQRSPDPAGKPLEFVRTLDQGPYFLLDVSVRPSVAYPCPMLTLGGLVVDEVTGQVMGEQGSAIPGLYAAGRTAAGMCSNSYISGLSLADCVFSGRRAGRHVASAIISGRSRAHG